MMESPYALIDGYLEGILTDEQFAQLVAWLHADKKNAGAFAIWTQTHNQIEEHLRREDAMSVLEYEAFECTSRDGLTESNSSDGISARQLFSLSGYLLRKALTSKPAYQAYAAAAVILVSATLFLAFRGGWETTRSADPLAAQDHSSDREQESPTAPALALVASLTNEHDAKWDRRPGDDLYAGQRFTLNRGVAEITTSRGAVAVIQAPATFELIDNDNALVLLSGKLLGICETESSKGFLVQTPQLDIIDVGTRFGVKVDDDQGTELHVLLGKVQALLPQPTGHKTLNFGARQAVQVVQNTASAEPIEFRADRFVWAQDGVDRMLSLDDRIQVLSSAPSSLQIGQLTDKTKVFVFKERDKVVLSDALPVIAGEVGSYYGARLEAVQPIAAGTRVDSYLLHMEAGQQSGRLNSTMARYTFDKPILGLIVDSAQLQQTDDFLGSAQTRYPTLIEASSRGLEKHESIDRIHIEPDGRTIVVELNQSTSPDQLRVLLRAENAPATEQSGS